LTFDGQTTLSQPPHSVRDGPIPKVKGVLDVEERLANPPHHLRRLHSGRGFIDPLSGVISSDSALRGTLLHEAPFVFSVVPAFVAILALGYVGGLLLVRGRDAMPERPRLVTWLILANFLVPVGSFAVMLTTLWLRN